jgi:alpha-ketoglutarate-dependent taurine dioxygenase
MKLQPLSEAIGVEVTGLDLSRAIPRDTRAALEAALAERLVMVVRDQSFTPKSLLEAVENFGPIMQQHLAALLLPEHPQIVALDSSQTKVGADGRYVAIGARDWHTDHAHQERPPHYTALYAVRLPDSGGDTSFANMQRAYEHLPAALRDTIDGLTVITKIDDRYSSAEDSAAHSEPHRHPLVRTHPITRKRGIFVHPGMVARFDGMQPEESQTFLEDLLQTAITPNITYRHQWRPGDLVITDNRGQMHVAHQDYDLSFGRILHRVLVEGETPY